VVRRTASAFATVAVGVPVALAALACTPTFTDDTAIVTSPRLLAVQSVPPEATPGGAFAMTALYVGPGGPADASSIDWATCALQNPLGDPDPINPACFEASSPALSPLGTGASVKGTIPQDACELFGPESPPPMPGQPSARPTDPDTTGGFYLPIRVETGAAQWSAALERIACQPSGVVQSVFTAFTNGYQPNANPVVSQLSFMDSGGHTTKIPEDGGGPSMTAASVAPGARFSIEVEWPSCPATAVCGDGICSAGETASACPKDCTTPKGCGGAETYLSIDPTSKQVTTQRESIVASFYAAGGSFDVDRVGRDGSDLATKVVNGWTSPSSPGPVHLWVVLRDARGGVGWGSYTITIAP
jgi:hypothetical protein